MPPQHRRLHFAVGTGLLTASLAAGPLACNKDKTETETPHVNEGPETEPETEIIANPGPEAELGDEAGEAETEGEEPPHVNEGPEAEPE